MKKIVNFFVIGSVFFSLHAPHAAETLSPAHYIRDRGWEVHDSKQIARSPDPAIAPVMYDVKGGAGPGCGLVIASKNRGKPYFVELVTPETGSVYPYCMSIVSMVPFKLNARDYIAVEFVQRDTREEFYRYFVYLFQDANKNYIVDESLNAADPNGPSDASAATPSPSKARDGERLARVAYLAKTFPQWQLSNRHFILDKSSSFAVFEDPKAQRCHFVVEAGLMPVVVNHTELAPGKKCSNAIASSRFEKSGTVYYLVMFKSENGEQPVAIISRSLAGQVVAEKALSHSINRLGKIKDIRSAKDALFEALRSHFPLVQ